MIIWEKVISPQPLIPKLFMSLGRIIILIRKLRAFKANNDDVLMVKLLFKDIVVKNLILI